MIVRHLTLDSGASLCVHDEGEGPLMVFISGLGGTAQFWLAQRRHFAARFRVVSFDQPGCGAAPAMSGAVAIADLAVMAAQMLEKIAPQQVPAVLVGHSTGGAIAQAWLTGRHGPAPARLVLSGSWTRACPYMHSLFALRIRTLGPDCRGDLGAYADLTRLLACDPADMAAPLPASPVEIDPVRAATQIARIHALLAFDAESDAPGITAPTLVIGAADDRIVPIYHQRRQAGLIPGALLNVLPHGGHFYPQTRSAVFNGMLESWLQTA